MDAEQLGLEETDGDGRAVNGDVWPAGRRAGVVDQPRKELLARSGVARQEHIEITGHHLARLLQDSRNGSRSADYHSGREAE